MRKRRTGEASEADDSPLSLRPCWLCNEMRTQWLNRLTMLAYQACLIYKRLHTAVEPFPSINTTSGEICTFVSPSLQTMHLLAFTSILIVAAAGLCQAQADSATDNADDHWCGAWAGSPVPADVPSAQQLPPPDFTKRFFVEPQLTRTPFAPIMASEPKVQVPKLWGNSAFLSLPPPPPLLRSTLSQYLSDVKNNHII